jgi:hypothetical protein
MTPDPVNLKDLVLGLILLSSLGVNIVTLLGLRKTQRREVSFQTEYMTRSACEREHEMIDAQLVSNREALTRVHARIDELRREIKDDVRGVHDRINTVLTAVSQLQGKVSASE